MDGLGRTIAATARNGPNPVDWYTTRSTYDMQGNLLTVTDALGRLAFAHNYDLARHLLRIDSIDAGSRRSVLDAAEVERLVREGISEDNREKLTPDLATA